MSIFGKIKDAIFGGEAKAAPKTTSRPTTSKPPSATTPNAVAGGARKPISGVVVEERLDNVPGADKLNWRTSIVDLMKLVQIDPSYDNRKELAREMGRSDYGGSADDNIWLHKRVMSEIAKNGGIVPAGMKD